MWALGLMLIIMGGMLMAGEYLCVEVAWRCLDYNYFNTGLGASMLGMGVITAITGAAD